MGVLGMVLGPSGSGKSTSLIGFGAGEVEIYGVTSKRLPFRMPLPLHQNAGYREIYDALIANEALCYVIDDSTYLMQFDSFRRAQEKGFDKFVTMAISFQKLLEAAMATSDDTTVYFLHHPQFADNDSMKPQTIGKMLDNQLCIEGLFDIILECAIVEGQHVFYTNEHSISKTPLGMFDEQTIPNNLFDVDKAIREFWGMKPLRTPAKRSTKTRAQ